MPEPITAEQTLSALRKSARGFVVYRLRVTPDAPTGGVVEFVTDSIRDVMGVSDPADLNTWFAAIHDEDLPRVMEVQHHCRRTGEAFDETFRVVLHGETRWLRFQSNPIVNEQGEHIAFAGMAIDVTERERSREAQALVAQRLHDTHRLNALAQFSARTAHDVNNLLQGVMALAMLHQHTEDEGRRAALVDDIVGLIERGGRMTRDLLGFARAREASDRAIDVAEVAARSARIADQMFPGLRVRAVTESATVHLDPAELEQALLNLLLNAAHASDEKGEVVVRVSGTEQEVRIAVEDRGKGIAPDDLERVTQPYFTTRSDEGGTGLGLAAVKLTAARFGGRLVIESTLGQGATFTLVFPPAAGEASPAPPRVPVPAGTQVLLVETDPLLRESLSLLLPKYGLKLHTAADGPAAQEVLAGLDHLDLAVIDTNITAREIEALRATLDERFAGLPLVLLAASAAEPIERAVQLTKPFHLDALLDGMGAALDAA